MHRYTHTLKKASTNIDPVYKKTSTWVIDFFFFAFAVIKHTHTQRVQNIYGAGSLLMLVGVHFYRSTVLETGFMLRGEPNTPFHLPVSCYGNRGRLLAEAVKV